jgi:hypothetical protein
MALTPLEAAESCIRRGRRFIELANQRLKDSKVKNDLRRMAIVMAAAAVDTLMHARILGSLGAMNGSDPSKALRRLEVPFGDLIDVADETVRARREGRRSRPRVQAKNILHARLSRESYQSSRRVEEGLGLLGIQKGWTKISGAMKEPAQDIKRRLDQIVHRRNQIVHEGDLRRLVRPRKLSFNKIEKGTISGDLDWVESLVTALAAVV